MKWAALIVWVITALGGFGLLGIWLQRGGLAQARMPGRRIRPPLIFTHMALAAGGLVLWVIYLATHKRGLAWAAFALLLAVAGLGFAMLALWLQRRQASGRTQAAGPVSRSATAGPGGPAPAATVPVATAAATSPATAPGAGEGALPAEQHFPLPVVAAHGIVAATTLVLVLLAALKVGGA